MARRSRPGRKAAPKPAAPRILVLHGPNLNLLGEREPAIYGKLTLAEINARIREASGPLGVTVEIHQANSEGALIDAIHAARRRVSGVVVNPGAFAHTSLALADALRSVPIPAIEVHLSNVFAREEYRQRLVVAPSCRAVVSGLGWRGYVVALQELAMISWEKEEAAEAAKAAPARRGRAIPPASPPPPPSRKPRAPRRKGNRTAG